MVPSNEFYIYVHTHTQSHTYTYIYIYFYIYVYYIFLTYTGWRPGIFLCYSHISQELINHCDTCVWQSRDCLTLQQHRGHEEYVQKPLCIKPLRWALNGGTQHLAEFYNLTVNLWTVLNECCSSEIAHPIAQYTLRCWKSWNSLTYQIEGSFIRGYKHF